MPVASCDSLSFSGLAWLCNLVVS